MQGVHLLHVEKNAARVGAKSARRLASEITHKLLRKDVLFPPGSMGMEESEGTTKHSQQFSKLRQS